MTGPYVVTVSGGDVLMGNRAKATLSDARRAAKGAVWRVSELTDPGGVDIEDAHIVRAFAECDALPETGGKLSELPDGTVIEVEAVDWSDINPDMDGGPMDAEDAEIELAVYNAAQEVKA